tara:strand:+ start:126 stop:380 length:255 start_codon:yes stop_codon:yes gene_type:complete
MRGDIMSWKKILKAECKVSVCEATSCGHNKHLKCTLPEVTISNSGSCLMFTEHPLSPSLPEKTRGQKSFIDRATRNLREQERNQ